MSPNASTIEEEGVLLDNVLIVRDGKFAEHGLRKDLATARYPARNPDQNIADLKAQVAANARGAAALHTMIDTFGLDVVQAYMLHVQDNAEQSMRRLMSRLSGGRFELRTDQGAKIEVKVDIDRENGAAHIDFTGTSPQQRNNFNAPEPVTRACVLYVLRVLLGDTEGASHALH